MTKSFSACAPTNDQDSCANPDDTRGGAQGAAVRIRFRKKLYKGRKIVNARRVRAMLEKGRTSPDVYCLLRSADGKSLELMCSAFFRQPWYQDREFYVVGIAAGRMDGIRLLASIVEEAVRKSGDPDPARYLFAGEDGA